MATLIKGLLAHNLDWQFVLVGVALAVTMELCGVESLSFAVGAYLPLSTTAPVFVGRPGARAGRPRRRASAARPPQRVGARPRQPVRDRPRRGRRGRRRRRRAAHRQRQLGGRVGALSIEHALDGKLGPGGYQILGLACFAAMGATLLRVARRRTEAK